MKRRPSVYLFLSALLLSAACSSPVVEPKSEDPVELEPEAATSRANQPTLPPTVSPPCHQLKKLPRQLG
jgi:hypothetical protein